MNLLVPPEIKRDLTANGVLRIDSKYRPYNLKGLIYSDINNVYCTKQIWGMLNNEEVVSQYLPNAATWMSLIRRMPYNEFAKKISTISPFINGNTTGFQKSARSIYIDEKAPNLVMGLHQWNVEYIRNSVDTYLYAPNTLFEDYYNYNEFGQFDKTMRADFDNGSFMDGTWHPESIFTNTAKNRANPYWVPIKGDLYERGLGTSYLRDSYYRSNVVDTTTGKSLSVPKSMFPFWQYTVQNRPYEKSQESFIEDGTGDRRVESTRFGRRGIEKQLTKGIPWTHYRA